jgi:AbrB family looped-hinge helix DNA binding protein
MAYGILDGMKLKVDKVGRIVLPKPVRDRLRLHAESDLIVEERAEGILLRPVKQRASPVQKHGLFVHRGEPTADANWSRLAEDQREERIKELAGT